MRRLVLMLLLGTNLIFSLKSQEIVAEYIETYQFIAVSEMERTGIPASIKLAQGLLESSWGQSELSQFSYNHFGIKCGSKWDGGTYYKVDDDLDEHGQLRESCFRVFESAEASYIAHSEFLINNKRYSSLFDLSSTNYKSWAKGLRKAGYATDPAYPKKLIKIIEKYDLAQFDFMAADEIQLLAQAENNTSHEAEVEQEIAEATNPEQAFMDESIEEFSAPRKKKSEESDKKIEESDFDKKTDKISKDLSRFLAKATSSINEETNDFTKNFQKRKSKKKWQKGKKEEKEKEVAVKYIVKKDETIAMIAHEHGTSEEDIRLRNFLDLGDEVQEGETLYIRGERKGKKVKLLKLMIAPEDEYLFDDTQKKE